MTDITLTMVLTDMDTPPMENTQFYRELVTEMRANGFGLTWINLLPDCEFIMAYHSSNGAAWEVTGEWESLGLGVLELTFDPYKATETA